MSKLGIRTALSNIPLTGAIFLLIIFELFNLKWMKSWRRGVVVTATVQLHSSKSELRFCASSNPACGVSEIHDGEDL